jgi:putative NIF3 family GTP cyclohydrolase 1 type 2
MHTKNAFMNFSPFSLNDRVSRRAFVTNALATAGAFTLSASPLTGNAANVLPAPLALTVQHIIDLILQSGHLSPLADTVDTIKSGKGSQVVTGIVTTMFPTIRVIEEAVIHKANFIIAHEPTFYNHRDDTAWVKNNTVVAGKQAVLEKHGITVWRFHDYCHAMKPDMISYGVAKKANWLSWYKTGEWMLDIPTQSLRALVLHLKRSLGIAHVRVIGDLGQPCSRIALMPGAWGGQRQVAVAESEKPDVVIVGEVAEWETAEYIRDSQLLGRKTALLILGHSVSEEPGMEWLVDWLQPRVQPLKVVHVASGDPFTWI